MSTETQRSSVSSDGLVIGASWILALLGLWVLATPFFWGPQNAAGFWDFGGNWLYWSNIATGILITAVAGYSGYSLQR